jgi:hypothetical protein
VKIGSAARVQPAAQSANIANSSAANVVAGRFMNVANGWRMRRDIPPYEGG